MDTNKQRRPRHSKNVTRVLRIVKKRVWLAVTYIINENITAGLVYR